MKAGVEFKTSLSRRAIALIVAGSALVAFLVLFVGILPAEYNRDPLGLGKATGIAALWAPEEKVIGADTPVTAGEADVPHAANTGYPAPFTALTLDIPLKAGGDGMRGDELEYKVHLNKGASYVYSWSVEGIEKPDEFYTEFHGHTVDEGKDMTVAYYKKASGTWDNGVLIAPFDGVHGWFFQNQSEKPVTVKLRIVGFYELIPAGQPGNEFGLEAQVIPVGN